MLDLSMRIKSILFVNFGSTKNSKHDLYLEVNDSIIALTA